MWPCQRKIWWGPFSLSIPMWVPGAALTSGLCAKHFISLEPSLALFLFVYLWGGHTRVQYVCAQVCVCMACAYRRPRRSSKSMGLPGIGVCKSPHGAGTSLALCQSRKLSASGLPLQGSRCETSQTLVDRRVTGCLCWGCLENSSLVFCMCWWCLLSRD